MEWKGPKGKCTTPKLNNWHKNAIPNVGPKTCVAKRMDKSEEGGGVRAKRDRSPFLVLSATPFLAPYPSSSS
eukprot:3008047-Pyramimonas_sp.AAC.1